MTSDRFGALICIALLCWSRVYGFQYPNCKLLPSLQSRSLKETPEIDVERSFSTTISKICNSDPLKNSSNLGESTQQRQLAQWQGFAVLNFIAILWGSQHVVIKSTLEAFPSTSLLNSWRFFLSTVLFFPSFVNALKAKVPVFPAGMELGLYTFLGFAFQAIGLETTTASRSAFLLYLNVKFVPFLAAVLLGRAIPGSTWLSAALALAGTCLLSSDGGGLNTGDAWCIAAAVASALFILRLEGFAAKYDAAELNGVSFATVAGLCGLWVLGDGVTGQLSPVAEDDWTMTLLSPLLQHPLELLYLGVITTALCNFLQTIGQRSVSAERAAIIYSMDPVYGAVFSSWILHEEFGPRGFAGAGLILLGIWVSSQSSKSTTGSIIHVADRGGVENATRIADNSDDKVT